METSNLSTAGSHMSALVLDRQNQPLRHATVAVPVPAEHEILIKVMACGVCRTDLHILDGDLAPHRLPLIPGHEVAGTVVRLGARVNRFKPGDRVGVPWLAGTCRHCAFCLAGRENLCDTPVFTGYDRNGGYAEYAVADPDYCFLLPDRYDAAHAAPLLCAGLIGYRAFTMAGDAERIGLYGFGASAHIIAQVALKRGLEVYAFTRPGDARSQAFALSLGVTWAGDSETRPPVALDAAIIFAPEGSLVPRALAATRKGAAVVCAGIHMRDIPSFPYALLWGERVVRSVANLTRADGDAFFSIAGQMDIKIAPILFPLQKANEALSALRAGKIDGAAVLIPDAEEVSRIGRDGSGNGSRMP